MWRDARMEQQCIAWGARPTSEHEEASASEHLLLWLVMPLSAPPPPPQSTEIAGDGSVGASVPLAAFPTAGLATG